MANPKRWVFCSIATVAGVLVIISTSFLVVLNNGSTTRATMATSITTTSDTKIYGYYPPPTTGAAAQDDEGYSKTYTLHELIYTGTAKERILRGFLFGSLLGLLLALCCCCWVPFFRDGPREGPDGIELANMAGHARRGNSANQAVMSGALPADPEAGVAGPSTSSLGRSRAALARAMRNNRRTD
ncbi:hypothetical protein VdG2_00102 [Verticillium dahliae VDG2]|nr:hypothetical protein VdG2_00102 [Verticillium dahliae VDG2]